MSQEKNPSNESMEELDRAEALPETTIGEKTEEKKEAVGAAVDEETKPLAKEVEGAGAEAATEEPPAAPDGDPAPLPDWEFGGAAPAKKSRDLRRFVLIFCSVVLVCVLLLVAVLLIGDGGLRFIKVLHTDRTVFVKEYDSESGLLSHEEAAARIRESTVTISVLTVQGTTGTGSGFVYTEDGYIITNEHVVGDAIELQVILPDGSVYDARLIGSNSIADVAVIKIDADGLKPVKLGTSSDLLVGEEVFAVGSPASLDFDGSATFGRVSAANRLVAIKDTAGNVTRKLTLIQTDATLNPGNSGGPLANLYGEVVGVVVMKYSIYGDQIFEGMGFVLPIDGVKTIADALIKTGFFHGRNPIAEGPSRLGVQGHGGKEGMWYYVDPELGTLSSDTAKEGYHYMPVNGLYVMDVTGAGVQSKLREGDVITKVNGLHVYSTKTVIDEVNRHYVGEIVELTVLRYRSGDISDPDSYEEITVSVTLTEG